MKTIGLFLIVMVFLPCSLFAEVHPKAKETIKSIFSDFDDYRVDSPLMDGQEVSLFTVFSKGKPLGWAVILNEAGKLKEITFLVGIDAQGKVLAVYVLEYREMFGSEIKRRSFLRQFQGKTLKDPIKIGQDIDAVTQATISSQAAASAVRRALTIIENLQKGF